MITFICCFNNEKQLNKMLLQSLQKHCKDANNNLILISPIKKGYKSAAQAYNTTIQNNWDKIEDIIIFCHQDIAFDDTQFLDRIIQELKSNPFQIIGFAGITDNGMAYSNLRYYKTKEYITRNRVIESKLKVESVDECCFATTKQVLQKISFDEKSCFHWHLYSVDLCYEAKILNIPSYIIPETIYHKENSNGGLYTDMNFLKTMWNLVLKYKERVNCIYAPCYICPTMPYKAIIRLLRTAIKNIAK